MRKGLSRTSSKGEFRAEAEDRDPQPERTVQLATQRRRLQEQALGILDCAKEELEKDGRERAASSSSTSVRSRGSSRRSELSEALHMRADIKLIHKRAHQEAHQEEASSLRLSPSMQEREDV